MFYHAYSRDRERQLLYLVKQEFNPASDGY